MQNKSTHKRTTSSADDDNNPDIIWEEYFKIIMRAMHEQSGRKPASFPMRNLIIKVYSEAALLSVVEKLVRFDFRYPEYTSHSNLF